MSTTSQGRLPRNLAQPRNTIKRLAYRGLAGPVYYDAVFKVKEDQLDSAMNKRTFLKLSSATIASPAVSRLLAWAGADKLTNWAGNLEYSTENLYAAKSIRCKSSSKNKPNSKSSARATASTTSPTAKMLSSP
jgi:hypothetical protein